MIRWWDMAPPRASTIAGDVDAIYAGLWIVTIFFVSLIALLILAFLILYRRNKRPATPEATRTNMKLELSWCLIPLAFSLAFFVWGAADYLKLYAKAPPKSYEVYVTGKQWMWKFQHPTGQREINELHVPINVPVKLIMISQDVIHSFFVPAFRIKHDVLPMLYTHIWFEAIQEGRFPLYCTEYCGTMHAGMKGHVFVMNAPAFEQWLIGGATEGTPATDGETLMVDLGCRACHSKPASAIAPQLEGIFGQAIELEGGKTVDADENYIRESILNPNAKIVRNYQPVMPPYQGRISEEQLMAIIAYIKSQGVRQ